MLPTEAHLHISRWAVPNLFSLQVSGVLRTKAGTRNVCRTRYRTTLSPICTQQATSRFITLLHYNNILCPFSDDSTTQSHPSPRAPTSSTSLGDFTHLAEAWSLVRVSSPHSELRLLAAAWPSASSLRSIEKCWSQCQPYGEPWLAWHSAGNSGVSQDTYWGRGAERGFS
jgi:hypothetical protein